MEAQAKKNPQTGFKTAQSHAWHVRCFSALFLRLDFYFILYGWRVTCRASHSSRIIVIDLIFMIHRPPPPPPPSPPCLAQIGAPSFVVRVNWMKIIKGDGKCNLKGARYANLKICAIWFEWCQAEKKNKLFKANFRFYQKDFFHPLSKLTLCPN